MTHLEVELRMLQVKSGVFVGTTVL